MLVEEERRGREGKWDGRGFVGAGAQEGFTGVFVRHGGGSAVSGTLILGSRWR